MKRRPRSSRKQPSNWLGRALTGLMLGLGVGAVALSFVSPAQPAMREWPLPVEEAPNLGEPSSPARATRASEQARTGHGSQLASEANPVLRPTPRPIVRAAPPRNAPSAIGDVRSISGAQPGREVSATPQAPFSVVVALEDDSPLMPLATAVVDGLRQRGFGAALAPLQEAGRPDVILALNAVEGNSNEAWYCVPGPEQSTVLALALLEAVGPGTEVSDAETPQTEFPCEDIHSGRARVPAVLLEIGAGGLDLGAPILTDALGRYFDSNRGAVLAARAEPRLRWPALGPVTSHYNAEHPLGIDIGQWVGPVLAATDGVVAFAGGNPCCSYGRFVVIQGADGIGTLYAHLSSLAVSEGQRVRQGDVLGEVGCTGTCFGTHLHFEVFKQGQRQNPMRYLP